MRWKKCWLQSARASNPITFVSVVFFFFFRINASAVFFVAPRIKVNSIVLKWKWYDSVVLTQNCLHIIFWSSIDRLNERSLFGRTIAESIQIALSYFYSTPWPIEWTERTKWTTIFLLLWFRIVSIQIYPFSSFTMSTPQLRWHKIRFSIALTVQSAPFDCPTESFRGHVFLFFIQ